MKRKFLAIALSVVFLAACAKIAPIVQSICDKEQAAHEAYLQFIAPFRPASAVARELAFYKIAMSLCSVAAPEAQIRAAVAQSDAQRQTDIRAVQRTMQRK